MRVKCYTITEDYFYKYFYNMSWDQQMTINYQFGSLAHKNNCTVLEVIAGLIVQGKYTYKGIPVRFKSK